MLQPRDTRSNSSDAFFLLWTPKSATLPSFPRTTAGQLVLTGEVVAISCFDMPPRSLVLTGEVVAISCLDMPPCGGAALL